MIPPPHAVIEACAEDGAVLRLRRHGRTTARTRLFISHGNGFASDGYVQFWGRFLGDFDVVVFDMRSHGQNPPAGPSHHDYRHMVGDIAVVAEAARAEFGLKPAAGIFHSMSAQSALLQTMAGDGLLAGLVLFDPPNVPPNGDPGHEPMLAYLRTLTAWAAQRRERFSDPAELAEEYGRSRSGRIWAPGAGEQMARAVLRPEKPEWALACPRTLEASMYRQGIDLGLWPRRGDVPVPVRLIGADPERAHPAATALSNRALARDGGFDYLAVPETSHLMQLEKPGVCAEAALDALRDWGLS